MTDLYPALISELAEIADSLAKEAGAIGMRRRAGGVSVHETKSSQVDVVTAVDLEIETWIRGRLSELRPHDAVLGEEEGAGAGSSGLTWVIDPIDGTVNFLYGLPYWSVSVAVCTGEANPAEWELVAGAVNAPALGTSWRAAAGQGAYRDGRRLEPRAATPLEVALVVTGFGYTAELRAEQGAVAAAVVPQVRDLRRLGSAAVDLCLVADGSVDAYYETGVNAWDIAAGMLVVQEAGGKVVGSNGQGRPDHFIIAGHAGTAAQLAAVLASACEHDSSGV